MKQLFMKFRHHIYFVNYPAHLGITEAYLYAREKLKVPVEEITPWEEAVYHEGIAKFSYQIDGFETY